MGDGQPAEKRRRVTKRVQATAIDQGTGAVFDLEWEQAVPARRPRDQRATEPFAIAFPAGVRQLAELDLTGTDWDVLMELVGMMGFEDAFEASPTKVGELLGLDRRNVARSLGRLKAKGVLIDRGRAMVLINPDYFWRGRIPKRLEMLHRLDRERQVAGAGPKNRSGSAAGDEEAAG